MTVDQVDALVREANPIPDASVLEAPKIPNTEVEAVAAPRATDLPSMRPRHPRWSIIAVASILIALVGLQIAIDLGWEELIDQNTTAPGVQLDQESAIAQESALITARGFVEARINHNPLQAVDYLADDAIVDWGPGTDSSSINNAIEWEDAFQLSYTMVDCLPSQTDSVGEIRVRCIVDQHSPLAEVRNQLLEPGVVELTVNKEQIREVRFEWGNFEQAVWKPFQHFIIQKQRDSYSYMFTSNFEGWPPKSEEGTWWMFKEFAEDFVSYYSTCDPIC